MVFPDSTGLAALVTLNNHTAHADGQRSLRDPRPAVRQVLPISGLDAFLIIITTTEHSTTTPAS